MLLRDNRLYRVIAVDSQTGNRPIGTIRRLLSPVGSGRLADHYQFPIHGCPHSTVMKSGRVEHCNFAHRTIRRVINHCLQVQVHGVYKGGNGPHSAITIGLISHTVRVGLALKQAVDRYLEPGLSTTIPIRVLPLPIIALRSALNRPVLPFPSQSRPSAEKRLVNFLRYFSCSFKIKFLYYWKPPDLI